MDDKRRTKVSKYLSKHLRHEPERLGLTLAPGGWVSVDELLQACARHHFSVTREELEFVVGQCDKQRFALDSTRMLIRANQGHSVEVDLQLEPRCPPALLYHGTARQHVEPIFRKGLLKRDRQHVHLSADLATATSVGARHGIPVVLEVDAARLNQDGHLFYCSDNGVWLTNHVPPAYLRVL